MKQTKNLGRLALTISVLASLFVVQQVFAVTAADVTTATGAANADETQSTAWKWLLSFAVGLFVGRKILGMFGR